MEQSQILHERELVIEEARRWIGTPYRHRGMIRGAGCDCISLIVSIYQQLGLIDHFALPKYSPQWNMHHSEELCLIGVRRYADEVPAPPERIPLPGDIVIFRYARAYSHNAIVADWPRLIHCWQTVGVQWGDAERDSFLRVHGHEVADKSLMGKPRPRKFFCLRRWE